MSFLGASAKVVGIFRKPDEQERKVKGGEEKGIGTGIEIETRGSVFQIF